MAQVDNEIVESITFTDSGENVFNITLYFIEVRTNQRVFVTQKRFSSIKAFHNGSSPSKESSQLFPGIFDRSAVVRKEKLQKYFESRLQEASLDQELLSNWLQLVDAQSATKIGDSFWNFRGSFKLIGIQLGTHMSLVRLQSGRFIVIDTIPLTKDVKREFDALTENGTLVDAVLATHPFHTLAFPAFYQAYPDLKYYGCPRHLRVLEQIPWAGDLDNCDVRNQWAPELELDIPAAAEFINPQPPKRNHFVSVFAYHKATRTLHVDDTLSVGKNPPLLLRLAGFKHDQVNFHPSIKTCGLRANPEAPEAFRQWLSGICDKWDFENLVTAHMGNLLGNGKAPVLALLQDDAFWTELTNKKRGVEDDGSASLNNVHGDECG